MIHYLVGDATAPQGGGPKIIAHVCNDMGGWGRGFVLQLSRRWPLSEEAYRFWYRSPRQDLSVHTTYAIPGADHQRLDGESWEGEFALGNTQLVAVEPTIFIANMIAQRGYKTVTGQIPLRYDALRGCLSKLAKKAAQLTATVHMPRIGTGLAGGNWNEIEPIIQEELNDIIVYVYDLPP